MAIKATRARPDPRAKPVPKVPKALKAPRETTVLRASKGKRASRDHEAGLAAAAVVDGPRATVTPIIPMSRRAPR
jgi:hypothetical protein